MKHLAIYGACGGVLIVAMRFVEYRFLVVSHSVEIYAALIAASFAVIGIWFGLTLTGRRSVIKEVFIPVALTFGLLSGVLAATLMTANMALVERIGFDRGLYIGYTVIVISFLFVYFGIRSYRDNVLGGRITFAKGFQAGILITLISCVFYVGAWLVTYYQFMPDFGDKYAAYMVEEKRASGASPAEIESTIKQGEDIKQLLDNPLTNAAATFTEPFPVGLLVTLISAAVLRKST